MSIRTKAAVVMTGAFALLASSVAPASAASENYYIEATGSTLEVSLLGNQIGSFAGTSAIADSVPEVVAQSFGFKGADSLLDVASTKAIVDALGATMRDPQGDGANCGVPVLPAELPVADLLDVLDVCSSSYAAVSSALQPAALAAADAGHLVINGSLLADLIFDVVLGPIMEQIDAVVAQLNDLVIAPVDAALAQVCAALPAEVSVPGVVSTVDSTGLPLSDVIKSLPNGQQIYDSLSSDCLLSLATLVDLVGVVLQIVEDTVRDVLGAALNIDLLDVTLGASVSTIQSTVDSTLATAEVDALRIATPSLQMLADALDNLLAGSLQGLIDQVAAIVPVELASVVAAIPSLGDVLDPALALLDLTGIIDDSPLLDITLAESVASAAAPRGGGDADISGSSVGALVLRISPAIAGLLGIDPVFTVAPSITQTIAEGTPLESTISVGQIEEISDVLGTGQVRTSGARVTATEINLLTGLNGGLQIAVAPATAQLGGNLAVAGPPQTSLPSTGAEDAVALAAAMAMAVLGLWVARRRSLID